MDPNLSNKKKLLSKTKASFYNELKKAQASFKPSKELQGYGGSAIVGEKNYPYLSTHNISNEEKSSSYKNTASLVKKPYQDIFKAKAKNVLGSTNSLYVKKPKERIIEELSSIYKSKNITQFSSEFDKEVRFTKVLSNKVAGIMGSKNNLVKLESTENTSTSAQIEKYTQEDVKSKEAIISLYEKGINEHQIINILALGGFGIDINKKLVPTRWAISAYDQTIEKHLHKKLLGYSIINQYEVYRYSDKGNHFYVILLPETFSGEVVEAWDSIIERDYVGVDNKLHKKEPETAGGFWATKCGVHEFLHKRKKQAAYISLRYIKDYEIPLGVVFVRECVREALSKGPEFKSSNLDELKEFLRKESLKHYNYFLKSNTLKELRKQKKLLDFF